MAKQISDLAVDKKKAEDEREKQAREKREAARKIWVPRVALIIANLIFISLDIRALDVVYKLTKSPLLAGATVIVSGVLALFWWDVLYPHSRRHENKTQINLSGWGVIIGVTLSLVLAFLDYIVGSVRVEQAPIWGMVVVATGAQAVMLGWWWKVDTSIESDAKREKSLAGRLDLQDSVSDFEAEINSMSTLAGKLEAIRKQFPRRGEAERAATAMGYPVLARMLADDDGDGIPNYKPRQQMVALASDTKRAEPQAVNPQKGDGQPK